MAGLVPAIHAFLIVKHKKQDVDARVKPGHDEREICGSSFARK